MKGSDKNMLTSNIWGLELNFILFFRELVTWLRKKPLRITNGLYILLAFKEFQVDDCRDEVNTLFWDKEGDSAWIFYERKEEEEALYRKQPEESRQNNFF